MAGKNRAVDCGRPSENEGSANSTFGFQLLAHCGHGGTTGCKELFVGDGGKFLHIILKTELLHDLAAYATRLFGGHGAQN